MQEDDETTAPQLVRHLQANGIKLSRSIILRCCRQLGWTFRGSAYCHLIGEVNKQERLTWCQDNLNTDLTNVIWTDETTVQLEKHPRFCLESGVKNHDFNLGWFMRVHVCLFLITTPALSIYGDTMTEISAIALKSSVLFVKFKLQYLHHYVYPVRLLAGQNTQ